MSTKSMEGHGDKIPAFSDAHAEKLVDVISRSQHNYRELIDNLDQAVFTLSADGEVRVANRRLCEILGIPFSDLVGHRLSEFVVSPTLEQAQSALPKLAEKGSWTGVIPIRLKGAPEAQYFHCWLQAVAEDAGATSIIGWARDITDQHESELRFAEFFQSLREGIFFTTADGRFLDANPAMIRMLGYGSKEELQSHNVREIYANPAQRDDLVRETTATGMVQDKEIEYLRKDGSKIVCLASAFVIPDPAGRTVRFQGRLVDITERREIERKLRQEQEFTRRLIECFPDLIVVLDKEGRFKFVSERIKDILGVTAEEYISKIVGQRTSPESRRKLQEMCRNIVSGKDAHGQMEVEAQHKDGSWKTLKVTASPLFDENGAIAGMVSSGRDVTESKRLEQQLAQTERLASMGQMMVGVAHELNNPLTAILGVSDLLRERAADEASRLHVELILKQARRAANIVQNLLSFSRPATAARQRLRVEDVVQQALLIQRTELAQKHIQVNFTAEPDLPPIEGDRRLLLHVLQNILTNAEQSISAGKDGGRIDISAAHVNDSVRVSIADNGSGIPADIMGKIFDPFFTTKRPSGGSGLGLAICMAVIKGHGGRIEAQSALGDGATLNIFLPAASGDSTVPEGRTFGAKAHEPSAAALRDHSVLVVDDEEAIREIVEDGLRAWELKAHSVGTSEEALSYLASHPCDVLVCDFNLPGLNGEKLFERLRAERGASAPHFIFMTGEMFDPATIERFRVMGVRILQKPFRVAALATMLSEILEPLPSAAK